MTWGSSSLFGGFLENVYRKRKSFGNFDCDFRECFTKGFFLTENEVFRNFSFDGKFSIFTDSGALKEIFNDSLKISKFTGICMENHSSMTGWQLKVVFHIQILLIFGGCF